MARDVVGDVDHVDVGVHLEDRALHRPDVVVLGAEIGGQGDDRALLGRWLLGLGNHAVGPLSVASASGRRRGHIGSRCGADQAATVRGFLSTRHRQPDAARDRTACIRRAAGVTPPSRRPRRPPFCPLPSTPRRHLLARVDRPAGVRPEPPPRYHGAMRVYLDHNASAPLRPEARSALVAALGARQPVEPARRGPARPRGGRAGAPRRRGAGRRRCRARSCSPARAPRRSTWPSRGSLRATRVRPQRVVVSAVEHHAVQRAAEALGAEGVRVDRASRSIADGVVDRDALAAAVGERTALVALHARQQRDRRPPAGRRGGGDRPRARRPGPVDAVQAAGKVPVDFRALGADYLAISAHKLGGPQGAGALVVRRGAPLEPLVHGGGQERGRRAGTENVAGIAGFGAAARAAARRPRGRERPRSRRAARAARGAPASGSTPARA